MTEIKVTVLVENRSVKSGLSPEHGLSLVLDIDGSRWLFDTGQSSMAVENARELGTDLKNIQGIILSHGHYDHTGGLESVLRETGAVDIYAHPGIFRERFGLEKNGKTRSVGIPFSRHLLEELGGRFSLSETVREISPGITLSGEIPRRTSFEDGDPFLVIKEGEQYIPDPFRDDQFILLDDEEGVIMITGCCHAGLINSLKVVRELHPGKKIKAVIGGLHLRAADHTKLLKIIDSLEPFAPEEIIAGHCTGEKTEAVLSRAFGRRFQPLKTGCVFEIN